ncbi:MAG: hypothetical protein ABFR97_08610 [Thermodesulfobacteriota bacterium]
MKRINWLTFFILPLFVFAPLVTPLSSWAQEEEEEAQPKSPDRPNPMERTMRQSAGRGSTMMLSDGRRLQQGMQGSKQVWYVVGKNGRRSVANGAYTLNNGQRMNIQRGQMQNQGQRQMQNQGQRQMQNQGQRQMQNQGQRQMQNQGQRQMQNQGQRQMR